MSDLKTTPSQSGFSLPQAGQEGLIAAVLLSFLCTAGLFYVNLGAAFLSAFVDGMGLSREQAGYVTAANKYGAAFGALLAVFTAGRLPWRKVAYAVLIGLISIDLISMLITDSSAMIAIRFLHGTVGGFLVGTGYTVVALTRSPDKVFGMLLVVQYSFGSIGIMVVPGMVEIYGYSAVFWALIAFSSITLLMTPFIANYKPKNHHAESNGGSMFDGVDLRPLIFVLFAMFLFQASNMGVADYVFELGKDEGLKTPEMSKMVGIANWVAVLGAVLVYIFGTKFGRTVPLAIGLLIAVSGTLAFHWSSSAVVFFIANAATGIMWAFIIPYLFGLATAFDEKGRTAALAGFVSKMGLASGPMIAATVVGQGNFTLIINMAAIGLALCLIVALKPAHQLDKLEQQNKREQG